RRSMPRSRAHGSDAMRRRSPPCTPRGPAPSAPTPPRVRRTCAAPSGARPGSSSATRRSSRPRSAFRSRSRSWPSPRPSPSGRRRRCADDADEASRWRGGGAPMMESARFSDEQTSPLFRRYPEAARRLPWLPLATLPTPVEPLALEDPGGAGARLRLKRDDQAGLPYGGNKVRQLASTLARARDLGATRLVTAGATGSHHALATAVYGRRLGFDVTLCLFPQPLTDHVRRVLLLDHA